ncbi:hypothetical protein M9Y10_040273 [Tritrichomonas musculus]|uniref:Surface antigen BspA-like protein n=1 Tax=Tritrichomonas musculus TaxID=1915356 RepID=A0ABR2GRM7_9EUKA
MHFLVVRNIERIEIQSDSKLQIIEDAFNSTKIESFSIPSNLIEFKDGWCFGLTKLKKIEISPDNQRYKVYEDKFIIEKSSIEHENYDCLVFCVRDIKTAMIPNFIEHFCSFAFEECLDLKTIEIPNDSKLKTIGDFAFNNASIERVVIPSRVEQIGEGAFHSCYQDSIFIRLHLKNV